MDIEVLPSLKLASTEFLVFVVADNNFSSGFWANIEVLPSPKLANYSFLVFKSDGYIFHLWLHSWWFNQKFQISCHVRGGTCRSAKLVNCNIWLNLPRNEKPPKQLRLTSLIEDELPIMDWQIAFEPGPPYNWYSRLPWYLTDRL